MPMKTYRGEGLRAVAMPLGGIGTGSVALCGDGSLRQWQVNNTINHLAYVPHSFFAIRAVAHKQEPIARVLQSPTLYGERFTPIPCCNDYVVPEGCKELLNILPGVRATEFTGEYPLAKVNYFDDALPVSVSLEAYSPFCPLDVEASSLPAIIFRFSLHNPTDHTIPVHLAATLQNFIGWDGAHEINGVESPQYGGNVNHLVRLRGMTSISMANDFLTQTHPRNGNLCLTALHPDASTRVAWTDLRELWNDFERDGNFQQVIAPMPSPKSRTVNGALSIPLQLEPNQTQIATFLISWRFPNRYVEWVQWFSGIDDPKSFLWLGNAYANRHPSALAVAEHVRDNFERLDEVTHRFANAFFDSTLPPELLDVVSSQMSIIRSPSFFQSEDGRFYGFEGCNGASTGGWSGTGGCCPLNCTHVFAYEMSLAALFPSLERSLRETELFQQLHTTGYLPHRVTVPLYLPRPWERKLGGPDKPALDGLLSLVLKTYREHRRSITQDWLESVWSKIEKVLDYVMTEHDTDGDGVLKGEQPNTYDISIFGSNTFIGTLYLAALRAGEEMARRLEKPELAQRYRERFEKGSAGYSEALWNEEYWIQIYDAERHPEQNYGKGCHSDQLFGQWWAYLLGLGDLLPRERVHKAVQSIIRYNLRYNFFGHVQHPRQFASEDEPGLLVCSWPHGDRPKVPTLYSDEIWTGLEYELAALCLFTGLSEDAIKLLRATRTRFDGRRRNPWNDIECGDHYIRALSSWGILDAACGYDYDAPSGALTLAPCIGVVPNGGDNTLHFQAFFIGAGGWGRVKIMGTGEIREAEIQILWGDLELRSLRLNMPYAKKVTASLGKTALSCACEIEDMGVHIRFAAPLRIMSGESLLVRVR